MSDIYLVKLNKDKVYKFAVIIDNKTIKFGRKPYSDFLQHENPDRRDRYVKRHSGMGEDWTKTGLKTRGFWAKHILWQDGEKPSLKRAIKDIEKLINRNIIYYPNL